MISQNNLKEANHGKAIINRRTDAETGILEAAHKGVGEKRDYADQILPAAQAEYKIIHILEEEIESEVIYFFCAGTSKARNTDCGGQIIGTCAAQRRIPNRDQRRLQPGGAGRSAPDNKETAMLIPAPNLKVYIATGNTDMRKAINGLSILVESRMELDPFSGHIFVFSNKRHNIIKILYWDNNGFCLWQKRLEKHRFIWPGTEVEVMELEQRQLKWLLEGLDISNMQGHGRLSYKSVI